MKMVHSLFKASQVKPNAIILEDEINGSITYKDFEEATGKLYNYLISLNLPKEKIIVIKLKRSYRVFIAIMGAIKAAVPYVIIGEESPQEYIDIVYDQCEPTLTLDDALLDKALNSNYLKGYKRRSLHDLALVVYSTGSTGLFKGSLHEYGALERIYLNTRKGYDAHSEAAKALQDMCFFFLSGFYSAASIEDLIALIIYQTKAIVIKTENAGNVDYLVKLAQEKGVYTMEASPLTLPDFVKHPISCIKEYMVCYEMFSCKYSPDYKIYNGYGLSESCGSMCFMEIDKDYDIAPVGVSCTSLKIKILDENDKPVKNHDIGELAFVPKFFRGYIKRDDLTKKALYNGYFHTGDLSYYDDNNNIVVVGRKKDCLKTNDGYIIPVFISCAIKNEFKDISKCLIKIYKDENPTMIVAYYVSENHHDLNEINNKIMDKLPSYSLPTHLVKLDKFEYFYCGKINRNLFEKPEK